MRRSFFHLLMIFAVTEFCKNIKNYSWVNLPVQLKIIRFSITSFHLLIWKTFATRPPMSAARKYNRIIESFLNETTPGVPGAQTQVPVALPGVIHQAANSSVPAASPWREMQGLVLILFHLIKEQLKILSCIFDTWFQLVPLSRTLTLIKALTCTLGACTMYPFILQGGSRAVLNIFF